ncbi:DUF4124 domain-containing protein [Pseudoduganella namucuonensis]|uniref:DUF4124 domain-containing protein n=1 Tax=Pseudoduganella namucuonensis TaxID=1035707 RepID=A0A1I7M2Y9_9BURK|nr:DUF4124 domain-containing protein [Pseudoduganella namucuonensis]SFV16207.1 hypothetical protein SAMN05216552_105036 [Pseudoduganella namucuonensis]
MKHLPMSLLVAAALAMPALAQAQYMWLDEKGMKQLSDQPPPPSVPQNRILKQPRQAAAAAANAAAAQAAAPADAPPAPAPADKAAADKKAPPSIAERNADFNKRRAEAAAAEQKSQQEAKHNADTAENCALARSFSHSLDSGRPISAYDDKGQRYFLSDEQRAQRAKRNAEILSKCPK